MDLNYIQYNLVNWLGELASTCKLFTNIDTEYVAFSCLIKNNASLKEIIKIVKQLGDKDYQTFCSMMVFEALIYNEDRHLNNFGILMDDNTGTILSMAPLYDHGASLFSVASDKYFDTFDTLLSYSNILTPVIDNSFLTNVAIFKGELQQKQLTQLLNFNFKKHPTYNLNDHRLDMIEKMIRYRANELLKIEQIDINNRLNM